MKNVHNELTCLFGHHDYSKELTEDRYGNSVHLCKICKRSGYIKWDSGNEIWYDYDAKGRCIHKIWRDGLEVWRGYDAKGNLVHAKWSDGLEYRANGEKN